MSSSCSIFSIVISQASRRREVIIASPPPFCLFGGLRGYQAAADGFEMCENRRLLRWLSRIVRNPPPPFPLLPPTPFLPSSSPPSTSYPTTTASTLHSYFSVDSPTQCVCVRVCVCVCVRARARARARVCMLLCVYVYLCLRARARACVFERGRLRTRLRICCSLLWSNVFCQHYLLCCPCVLTPTGQSRQPKWE